MANQGHTVASIATNGGTDLNDIAVFVRVIEAGSFTAAARQLGVPKSSTSRRVRQLEDALGVQLLQRSTRHLGLTDAGREYYARVSSALAGVQEAHAAVAELQDRPRGTVRLVAPSEWSGWILAPIIAMFVEQYPDISIDLSLTDRQVDLLREGFDLGLVAGPLPDSSLVTRTIRTIDSGLFASQAYLDRHGVPTSVDDLAAHQFIVRRPGPTNRLSITHAGGTDTIVVTGRVATDDRGFVYEAVRAGLGIGVLPRKGCAAHLGLVPVLPDHQLPGFPIHLIHPALRHVPQRVALFGDFLFAHLNPDGEGLCARAAAEAAADVR
ncbi:MAG: LysR family transcriptional regulator [Acidobacteria bacterium]|nr:LysR family transcriptional regulator [Acidobacteriota bacterium]